MIWTEQPAHVINLDKEPSYKSIRVSLHLRPVGFNPHPKDVADLKAIIHDVLKGLEWIHSHNYVHRDLRWPNIIRESHGKVRLIDLENADKEGKVTDLLSHWPSLDGGFYSKMTDLYLVGQMMKEYSGLFKIHSTIDREDAAKGIQFIEKLEAGLYVGDALNDPWLL